MTESLCCTPETITTLLINYESGVSLKLAQHYKSIMLQYKVKLKKKFMSLLEQKLIGIRQCQTGSG